MLCLVGGVYHLTMADYFDYEGQPISHERWIELFRGDRVVGRTRLDKSHFRGGVPLEVSTVWLGMVFVSEDPPKIFETMVFLVQPDSWDDLGCWRWATWDEALAGHREICRGIEDGTLELHDPDLY